MQQMAMDDYEIRHTKGADDGYADLLSEYPMETDDDADDEEGGVVICTVQPATRPHETGTQNFQEHEGRVCQSGTEREQADKSEEVDAVTTFPAFSHEELIDFQEADPDIKVKRDTLKGKIREEPISGDVREKLKLSAENLRGQKKRLVLIDDLLHRQVKGALGANVQLLIIPEVLPMTHQGEKRNLDDVTDAAG